MESTGIDSVHPAKLDRSGTFAPIIVPGNCGGDDQVYHIVRDEIPDNLKPLLSLPFTTEEREALFHAIDLTVAEHVPVPDRPKALWVFGPPAVGKSTMADEKGSQLFGRSDNAVVIDGDDMRMAHHGFQRVAQHGLLNHKVHADAWTIFKATKYIDGLKEEIVAKAIQNRQNLKIPDAALNPKRIYSMLEHLEASNYEMHAICLWAPKSETEVRGRARSVKAGKVFSTSFYHKASEAALELGLHWETKIEEKSEHYKSITYYDNTVRPSHPIHIAQFEILTRMTDEESRVHADMCKAAKEAHERADVAASEARARGARSRDVARLWLQKAKQRVISSRKSSATSFLRSTSVNHLPPSRKVSSARGGYHEEELVSLVMEERLRGRLEGFLAGVAAVAVANLFLPFLTNTGLSRLFRRS